MDYTIELNNARRDDMSVRGKFHAGRPVVEVFSSMVKGEPITTNVSDAALADKAANYIKGLASKAELGDASAVAELNALRVIEIEPKLIQELRLLGIFGSYKALGWNETPVIETYDHIGVDAQFQPEGMDVTFPAIKKRTYPIAPQTVSGGYAVNYRQLSLGDASKEAEGMNEVRKMIMNKALLYVMKTVVDKIDAAGGVKYYYEHAGLVKASVDDLLTKIRRFGRPNVIGDFAILSQFVPWVGFNSTVTNIQGISDDLINELNDNGFIGRYNGAVLTEMANPYNLYEVKNGNFVPMLPDGIAFVVPQGQSTSAIQTFSQGGLTTLTGNDITTGEVLTRFDLAVAADIATGREYEIGVIVDSNLTTL